MNTTELALAIRAEHGFTRAASRRILDTVLVAIRAELKAGRPVKLRNFGTFLVRTRRGWPSAQFDDSPNFFRSVP